MRIKHFARISVHILHANLPTCFLLATVYSIVVVPVLVTMFSLVVIAL